MARQRIVKWLFASVLIAIVWIGASRVASKTKSLIYDYRLKQICNASEERILEDEPDAWYAAPQPVLWAHAGGGQLAVYTNSKEAIEDSIIKGYNVIEIDVSLTRDGVPVLSHFFQPSGIHKPAITPSLEEFKSSKIVGRWTPLSLKECLDLYAGKVWLSIDPLSIILDQDGKEFDLIGYIEENTTVEQRKRIMYQIYTLDELLRLRNSNTFGALHFELYFFDSFLKRSGGGGELCKLLSSANIRSVSFGEQPITEELKKVIGIFNEHNIKVSVASVNTVERYWAWRNAGAFCFDSDLLSPDMAELHSEK